VPWTRYLTICKLGQNNWDKMTTQTIQTTQDIKGRRIMHIEDEPSIREIIKRGLEKRLGVSVYSAENLKEFYQLCEQNEPADLYISDGRFPINGTGFKGPAWEGVAKKVTELSQRYPGKIKGMVIITGDMDYKERVLQYPIIKEVMKKPVHFDELFSVVTRCLTAE